MPLQMNGEHGALLVGTRVLAEIRDWQKHGQQLTFAVATLNSFVAGLGQPPSEVRLHILNHWRRARITDATQWKAGRVTIGPTLSEEATAHQTGWMERAYRA